MIHNAANHCLVIGTLEFKKNSEVTYTTTNNSRDVLAALQLMTMLQLEDFVITGEFS
jgi:hypothetical protein